MAGRKNIYYWKSDRAFASENTRSTAGSSLPEITIQVRDYLNRHFRNGLINIEPANGQGNHITFTAHYPDGDYFVRLENGPEGDNYMAVESKVMEMVRQHGIPCPLIYLTDVSRTVVPFAIQVMDCVDSSDLNVVDKRGELDLLAVAGTIGRYVALWQSIQPGKYGLFNPDVLHSVGRLEGYHDAYEQYFFLNWDVHLEYLRASGFISAYKVAELKELVNGFRPLLQLDTGCLVHKDLALWNILGNDNQITAVIDWDDAVSGDPTDDLSLLGCFHSGDVVLSAIAGYQRVKALPPDFEQRFWLHLLRNIIFKSVIRVKGNYFEKSDKFFLNNPKHKGLKQFTLDRIDSACEGLRGDKSIDTL
ncbi:aminoglycoside phosphotransferase family protein [Parapedobacter sp. ISTM3]|uniref:phosphotransferase family protein n=1 Tax=Parapedobacter sp. ISTM3 TaxID=2800130 RepID=UPI0019051212|nr:aminoglycoside phosphotransferase family protein [Parapedobacter sp. ISTM3]MBK1439080.1 aminoglycoside phosphotransferase family protein [Parapedobacter sp. ISTM3]